MALSDYQNQMIRCIRCSSCKFVSTPNIKSWRYASGCPSISYGNFHSYSAGGKMITAMGLEEERIDYSEELLKTVHACTMCGNCDVSCKMVMGDMVEPLEIMRALRTKIVEDGEMNLAYMAMVENMKKEDNTFGRPKDERINWAKGLDVKDGLEEVVDVFLHVGCQLSYDEELWPVIRGATKILQEAGVNVGVARKEEVCCGGRAYDMGYQGEMENYAESMVGRVKQSGAKILVTCCSDCYGTFNNLYPQVGRKIEGVEILHITQLMERLVTDGKLKFSQEVPLTVTYHDPCHLGRLGDCKDRWAGDYETVEGKMVIKSPPKDIDYGTGGVYDAPRNILKMIPGVKLVEMERIREFSYCCGSGGGAKEAYPDFAQHAALERIHEARSTGASTMVTTCPWCERNFKDALEVGDGEFDVYDIIELVLKGIGKA